MSAPQSSYTIQQKLIAALRDPSRYPTTPSSVQLIETHISWVLLVGSFAYKIKKALDLGFLDYSTLESRRFCCDEEIRLNRRTAPDIYLDTIPVGGSPDNPKLGTQPAIEYAVRMRRFAPENLMDGLLLRGKVTPQHIDHLAAVIARFHAGLPAADAGSGFGTAASIGAAAKQNFEQLRAYLTEEPDRAVIAELDAATDAEFAACKESFEQRRTLGFVRECHGDLHLGNIVLDGDIPFLFDCIEFNPSLRWIDVMDEISFTVMDLLHRSHPEYAWRLLNACLEASGDYAGVGVLHFYLAYRSTVRAKVCAIRAGQSGISGRARSDELAMCRSYLALGRQFLGRHRPVLIITHGLPGSGKTTFSQFALQQMGAIRIRSDVERKRLFGLDALESSGPRVGGIYGPEPTLKTYAHLRELASKLLAAGFPVIVDAAFLKQEEREMFRRLAQSLSVPFAIATLQAKNHTLRERIRQRRNDASEADVTVLEKLRTAQEPLSRIEFAYAASFTTEELPGSAANREAWDRLQDLLKSSAQG
jgi:aminoglycoside phosphotransferase family enzyme/predicted kinase